MISVVIPFYNAEKYLYDSVISVLNQTMDSFELILLDDGSTDKSLQIANSFSDSRIRVISDGVNKGLPYRLNQMVDIVSYNLIARMDADDIIPVYRLEKQFIYLNNNPNVDLVSMGLGFINDTQVNDCFIPNETNNFSMSEMLSGRHGICHATLLIRRDWLLRNKYDKLMSRVEDHELWLSAYINNDLKIGFIPEVGYFYRSDVTLSKNKFRTAFLSGFKVLNKHKNDIGLYVKLQHYLRLMFKLFANELIFIFHLEYMVLSRNKERALNSSLVSLYDETIKKINER